MNQQNEVLDRLTGGFYSVGEVRRLSGVPESISRRFVKSYKGSYGLWGGEFQELSRGAFLTFRDLIEIRHIASFNSAGVTWQRIVRTARYAKERFESNYPFSDLRFKTDGVHIFSDAGVELEQVSLQGQMAFKQLLSDYLFYPVDYWNNEPVCWYPAQEWSVAEVGKGVVVDPRVAFGAPVIADYYIPTEVLYMSYKAEENNSLSVATNYEIPLKSVQNAISFEEELIVRNAANNV